MKKNFLAFLFGLIFGLGLIVAQMTNPAKVLAFLDITGTWDPSLAVVMSSALLVLGMAQLLIRKTNQSTTENKASVCEQSSNGLDKQLIVGAAIFGIGWGLSGICPGPALVGVSSGLAGNYVFVGAMFTGFIVFSCIHRQK